MLNYRGDKQGVLCVLGNHKMGGPNELKHRILLVFLVILKDLDTFSPKNHKMGGGIMK